MSRESSSSHARPTPDSGRSWIDTRSTEIEDTVVHRPGASNAFEFVVVASLRAAQLMRGCTPRVDMTGKAVTIAQREVAEGKVVRAAYVPKVT